MSEAKRKLAAILAAHVAGYSRLMGADEAATPAALDACRGIFGKETAARGGRVVDTSTESVLATFKNVVEEVGGAVAVQERLALRTRDEAEDRRIPELARKRNAMSGRLIA